MKCNVGGVDMTARLIIGAVLIAVGFVVPMNTVWQTVVFVLGGIALVTGAVRYCPLNAALGLNTCPQKSQRAGAE
jgi:hypothetical protein